MIFVLMDFGSSPTVAYLFIFYFILFSYYFPDMLDTKSTPSFVKEHAYYLKAISYIILKTISVQHEID